MLVVVDTNILLVAVSNRSKHHWLYKAILERKINIAFTNEILEEYEEMIAKHWLPEVATDVTRSLIELSTAKLTVVYFRLSVITIDEDDNKFVDCAFAANADYIVTNDSHFNVLKSLDFPSIKTITLDEFRKVIIRQGIIIQ